METMMTRRMKTTMSRMAIMDTTATVMYTDARSAENNCQDREESHY